MKHLLFILFLFSSLESFSQSDTLSVRNDSLQYEITIIDPLFNTWMIGNARPVGFYSLEYLESYNRFFVSEWNYRYVRLVTNERYQFYIDYSPNIRYGYEVNYLLFNYFQYIKIRMGDRLGIRGR
jgi:hypothetical protein